MTKLRRHRRLSWPAFALPCIVAAGAAAQTAPPPSEVLNRSYVSLCGRSTPVTLNVKEGKFVRHFLLADKDRRIELELLGAEEIIVRSDQRRHYAVFSRCNVLGKEGYEFFILRKSAKGLVQVASTVTDITGFDKVKYIRQSGGFIVVGMSYRPFGSTIPRDTDRYEFRYRFLDRKLVLVDRRRVGE